MERGDPLKEDREGCKTGSPRSTGDHHAAARQKRNGVYPLVKEASVVCYERENRFYDTNWSKSVLRTSRIGPRASMFMTRLVLI